MAIAYFDSTMIGVHALTGTAGALIAMLDDCLINGFGAVTVTPLVVASNIATGTVSTGHGFNMIDGKVGPIIRVSGATPSGLNGDFRITSIPSSTTFTYATTGINDQTATGTISAKIAPIGWIKSYSGTNKAVYARTDANATSMVLRIDDSTTTYATVRTYESATGIDTVTGPIPTDTQCTLANGRWYKSSSADSVARKWCLLADSKRLVFLPMWNASNNWRDPYLFGDLVSYLTGDTYHCLCSLSQGASGNPGSYNATLVPWPSSTSYPPYLARTYAQIGSAIAAKCIAPRLDGTYMTGYVSASQNNITFPDPITQGLLLRGNIEFAETTANALRGRWPGIYAPIQSGALTDGNVITGVTGAGSGSLLTIAIGSYAGNTSAEGRIYIDLLDWS